MKDTEKETIEEAIKKYCLENYGEGYCPDVEKGIKFGVDWQQERSFNEKEVYNLLIDLFLVSTNTDIINFSVSDWFEKHKK